MSEKVNRRGFLKKALLGSAGAGLGLSLEEQILLAAEKGDRKYSGPSKELKSLPMGRIGKLEVSRLICGGNLISGWAHSRDLIYVSELLRQYNTDEKVMETWEICEENGINTVLADPREKPMRILNRYWKERGGRIQWIAEGHPKVNDIKTNLLKSIDNGASAIYIQGGVGDKWVKHGRVDLIGQAVDFIKQNGLVAGVGGHNLDVPIACEEAGIDADFYMKTLHKHNYWSINRESHQQDVLENRRDNYWSRTPAETIEFMKTVEKPWIAFKVMAAGAIHPSEAFEYAFANGADFICAGMFDFQVIEDTIIAVNKLQQVAKQGRARLWRG